MTLNTQKIFLLLEEYITIIFLLFYSGGVLTLVLSGGANEGDLEGGSSQLDSSLILIVFFVNYIITIFLLLLRWKKVIYFLTKNKHVALLVALVFLSSIWSFSPPKTISRSIAIIGSSLFGLYLASRYSIQQQLQLLSKMYGIAIALSLAFVVALPSYGVMGGIHAGKWRGIFLHKNNLGAIMVVGVIVFFLAAKDAKKNQWLYWFGFIMSLVMVIRASSTSSLLNTVFMLGISMIYGIFRWRYHWMIPTLTFLVHIGLVLSFVLPAYKETFLTSLGKDATLTGRGDMWPFIMEMIAKKPLLGYGYGAFWLGEDSPAIYIWQATGWTPPHSHNGFLDICLHIGLLGFAIFSFGLLIVDLPKAFALIRKTKTSAELWPLLYITCLVLVNTSESLLLTQNDIFWVLYVTTSYSLITLPKNKKSLLI